jgi:hypothetical protein
LILSFISIIVYVSPQKKSGYRTASAATGASIRSAS